jgi:hypothetical protein
VSLTLLSSLHCKSSNSYLQSERVMSDNAVAALTTSRQSKSTPSCAGMASGYVKDVIKAPKCMSASEVKKKGCCFRKS